MEKRLKTEIKKWNQ